MEVLLVAEGGRASRELRGRISGFEKLILLVPSRTWDREEDMGRYGRKVGSVDYHVTATFFASGERENLRKVYTWRCERCNMRDAIINLQFSTVERSYFCTFKFVMLFYNNRFNSELQVICKLRISRDEEIRLRNIYVNIYTVYMYLFYIIRYV